MDLLHAVLSATVSVHININMVFRKNASASSAKKRNLTTNITGKEPCALDVEVYTSLLVIKFVLVIIETINGGGNILARIKLTNSTRDDHIDECYPKG